MAETTESAKASKASKIKKRPEVRQASLVECNRQAVEADRERRLRDEDIKKRVAEALKDS